MKKNISLTIGIITKDRPDFLKKSLENKYKQSFKDFYILVSDDSTLKSNINKNKLLCKRYNAKYLIGPRKGLYANRNNIMDNIQSSHLLTCDDDHLYPNNFVKIIMEEINLHSNEILVIGEVKNKSCLDIRNYMPRYINEMGRISENQNPESMKGISCGSTIYPIEFLVMNIRCDETYLFGRMWYLFALQILKKTKFNIRFITNTSIDHDIVSSKDRAYNINYLKHQQECNLYVSFIHAFYFSNNKFSILALFWKLFILISVGRKIYGREGRINLGFREVLRVIKNTFKNRNLYR